MGYAATKGMIIQDLLDAREMLNPQAYGFVTAMSFEPNAVTDEQFKVLNTLHDAVIENVAPQKEKKEQDAA